MAKKVIYFDKLFGFSVTAITEDGKLTDCKFTAEDGEPAAGNIYKGVVANVLDGMQAAVIDCGLERNCYLSEEDLPYGCGGLSCLKAGDELMVQIVKPPAGKKGAKVTAKISIVGKTLIYLPGTDFVGISHRLEDNELRENMIFAAKRAKRKGEGLVIRNAAPFSSYKQIDDELNFLRAVYERAAAVYDAAEPRSLICTDFTMPVRVMRDFAGYDVDRIVTANAAQYAEIKELLTILPGGRDIKLELYQGRRDMLDAEGVAEQMKEACSPRVDLENGAYLVIGRTEALTAIDVNTGGFIGNNSLEYTVYQTNLIAAREIARQVKVRNLGGLFVVDFIDMKLPEHRQALVRELEEALKKDGAPFRVLPMSEFGLVEFTRKRTGAELAAFALRPCPMCGEGSDFSYEYYLLCAWSEVLKLLDRGAKTVCAELQPGIAEKVAKNGGFAAAIREKFPDAEVYILPEKNNRAGECRCYTEAPGYVAPKRAIKII